MNFQPARHIVYQTLLAALIGLAAAGSLHADTPDPLITTARAVRSSVVPPGPVVQLDLERFHTVVDIADLRLRLAIPAPGLGTIMLDLARQHVMQPGTPIIAITSNGPVRVEAPKQILFTGVVEGHANSFVTMAVNTEWMLGTIRFADGRVLHLSPLPDHPMPVSAVVMEQDLQAPPDWLCATDDSEADTRDRSSKGESVQASKRRIDIALECDEPYYIDHGRDVIRAINYAEAVIGASSAIYDRDVDAVLNIKELTVWTITDPYPGTSSTAMLTQLRDYWRTNNGAVQRTVVHLFSGINGIGGVAYLNGLCSNNNGYAVSGLNNNITYPRTTYAWDTDVTSHELGHNVGSPHTHSCTWNPPIDSCYNAEGGCYTGTKAIKGTIMSYCHLTNQGKTLDFHPLVQNLMRTRLGQANCVQTISDLVVNAGSDAMICSGGSIQLQGSAQGGTPPYTISWTPAGGLSNAAILQPVAQPTQNTQYTLTVTDDLGVTRQDQVIITVNPPMAPTIPAVVDLCEGSDAALVITGVGGSAPYRIRWTSSQIDTITTDTMLVFTPLNDQEIAILVTDAADCARSLTTRIDLHPVPDITVASPSTTFCVGETYTLTATLNSDDPALISWYRLGQRVGTGPTLTVTADQTTRYTVVATTLAACSDTAEAVARVWDIHVDASPSVIPLPNLAPCERDFQAWVTVVNRGGDSVTFNTLTARQGAVQCPDLPLTLGPSSSHVLPLIVTIPDNLAVRDTLVLTESECGRTLQIVVSGTRGELQLAGSQPRYPLSAACDKPTLRTIEVELRNTSPLPLMITGARSQLYDLALRLPSDVMIMGKSTRRLVLDLYAPVDATADRDTIAISFGTTACSDKVLVAVDHPVASVEWQAPFTMMFDGTVSPALEEVRIDTSFMVTSDRLSQVTVTNVQVSGPFRTDLRIGTVVAVDRSYPVSVWFVPANMTQDGEASGSVAIEVDSCYWLSPSIALSADRRVVSVEEQSLIPPQQRPMVVYDALEVDDHVHHVDLLDLSGRMIARLEVSTPGRVDLSGVATGLYGLVLHHSSGSIQRMVVLKQ